MALKSFDPHSVLSDWETLHKNLNKLGEPQLKDLLNIECKHYSRPHFIIRIHARYSKLRTIRERRELLKKAG